jgi:hypothetical protein
MEWLRINKKISIDRKQHMDRKMTDKSTQNRNEIRRMRKRVFIYMIVKGNEIWQHRERLRRGQDRTRMGFKNGNQTIIINIVKRDKEVKGRLYTRYMSTKRKLDKYKQ